MELRAAAANEIDDLNLIPFLDHRLVVIGAFDNGEVVLDSDPARVDTERVQERGDRERGGELVRIAVQANAHKLRI
jgi:hypothetical protein